MARPTKKETRLGSGTSPGMFARRSFDFRRFANPRQLMAYLGLVPSEHSSGSTIRRGGITKAGNALARRALIEGAWSGATSRSDPATTREVRIRRSPAAQLMSSCS
ncbi:MAG TPA: IS110 family transposase [Steroidobacteraceae bacterium]|nr:IS110 family transposase [Steroidobacteraceae bacterium]